jgi:hypothetical protein
MLEDPAAKQEYDKNDDQEQDKESAANEHYFLPPVMILVSEPPISCSAPVAAL